MRNHKCWAAMGIALGLINISLHNVEAQDESEPTAAIFAGTPEVSDLRQSRRLEIA